MIYVDEEVWAIGCTFLVVVLAYVVTILEHSRFLGRGYKTYHVLRVFVSMSSLHSLTVWTCTLLVDALGVFGSCGWKIRFS